LFFAYYVGTDRFLENMKKRIGFIHLVKNKFLVSTAEYGVMEHFPDLSALAANFLSSESTKNIEHSYNLITLINKKDKRSGIFS